MPLPSKIRAVYDPRAIRREVRPGPPGCLLVMDLARLRAGLRPHPPKSAGSVDVPSVRNKKNFLSIPRPHRADLMIEHAVVIAGQGTLGFDYQPGYVFHLSVPHFPAQNMKSPAVRHR